MIKVALIFPLLAACSSSPSTPLGGTGSGGAVAGSGGGGGGGTTTSGSGGANSQTGGASGSGGSPATGGADGIDGGTAVDATTEAALGGCESAPSDDFSSVALSPCWKLLNGTPASPLITATVAGGSLHLRANGDQDGVWYRTSTKSLLYKELTATNFKVTTTAHPRKASAPTMLPTKDLHVGGVMVRDPSSNGGASENYLFLMVGHSENNNGTVHQGVEFKSTVNGCSDFNEPDWGAGAMGPDAQLRICRIGTSFRLFKRVPGDATWTPAMPPAVACPGNSVAGNVLTRSDLPETLQVGLALNFHAPSDLDVTFDEFSFVPLSATASAADCTSD